MPRPEISEDVIQEIEDLTDAYFNVPDTKVSFEDRVRILAEKLQEAKKRASQARKASDTKTVRK